MVNWLDLRGRPLSQPVQPPPSTFWKDGIMSNPTATTLTLVIERVFPHSPEKLWRALTESSLLAQWMMKKDFEPVVGHRFQFRADPMPSWNGVIDCKVLVVDPPLRLCYIWSPSAGGPQMVVLLTLTPAHGGTQLRMEQSGIP